MKMPKILMRKYMMPTPECFLKIKKLLFFMGSDKESMKNKSKWKIDILFAQYTFYMIKSIQTSL